MEFAETCHNAFVVGQHALDKHLWNETAQYYNAYSTEGFDYEMYVNATGLEMCGYSSENRTHTIDRSHIHAKRRVTDQICVEGNPATPGAIMTDSFYSQVGKIQQSQAGTYEISKLYISPCQ